MAKKKAKKPIVKVIKGELIFKEVIAGQVKFDLDENPDILSNRNFDVARNLVPADFEHGTHRISGTYHIEIVTEEK